MDFRSTRAVTFDAAHTLFHPTPSVGAIYQEVMREHGLNFETDALEKGFRNAFAHAQKDKTILDGERRERSYWEAIVLESISELGQAPKDFEALFGALWSTFAEGRRWRPAHKAVETLTELRSRGYRTALLTNWDKRVRSVTRDHGFDDLLDALFISSEIGHEKPEPEIFAFAEKSLGLAPREILHVGDSLQQDIEGPRRAGWQAVRICEEGAAPPDASYPIVLCLSELLTLLP